MKFVPLIITFLSLFFVAGAQNVGISANGNLAKPSAGLDIDFSDKGLLIPRISLSSTLDNITIHNPEPSLLVYNTNAAMSGGKVGFWYWDGLLWQNLKTAKVGESGWSTTGNSNLTAANFIGTTDNMPFSIYTNNSSRMTIMADGKLGIGTQNPQRKVHIMENDAGTPSMFVLDNANTANGNGISLSYRGTTTGAGGQPFFEFATVRSKYYIHDHKTANSALTFHTAYLGKLRETLKLTGQGYLGIGETDPKNYLHIVSKDGSDPVKIIGMKDEGATDHILTIDSLGIVKKKIFSAIHIITSSVTLDSSHHTVIMKEGGSITLPAANSSKRRTYRIINQTANPASITAYINFNAANDTSIPANSNIEIQSDGTNWYKVD